ncbi:hypothetical protein VTJ04DRAFT_7028 [Mycothermus thermophilus]|uniref:uncharacterized protein n=1 Tax=Humicola insolens TaxID=85995 RepID=UPI0037437E70
MNSYDWYHSLEDIFGPFPTVPDPETWDNLIIEDLFTDKTKHNRLLDAINREAYANICRDHPTVMDLYNEIPDEYIFWWPALSLTVCRVRGCLSFGEEFRTLEDLHRHCQAGEHQLLLSHAPAPIPAELEAQRQEDLRYLAALEAMVQLRNLNDSPSLYAAQPVSPLGHTAEAPATPIIPVAPVTPLSPIALGTPSPPSTPVTPSTPITPASPVAPASPAIIP